MEMDRLKDPAMVVSLGNTVGLVGVTAYFYKQMEAMRQDMVTLSQSMSGIARQMSEIKRTEQNHSEALHTLNDQLKGVTENLESMSFKDMSELGDELEELYLALEDNEIYIDRPSQQSKPPTPKRRTRNGRSRSNTQRSSSRRPSRRPIRQPISESSDSESEESDLDLINQVRSQQDRI
jgi:TolA-binding protein